MTGGANDFFQRLRLIDVVNFSDLSIIGSDIYQTEIVKIVTWLEEKEQERVLLSKGDIDKFRALSSGEDHFVLRRR